MLAEEMFSLRKLRWLASALSAFMFTAEPTFANIPGGGDGTGPNVTLVNNGDGTVTMANGVVTAQIKISTAQILQLTYNGVQVTDGGTASNNGFYWQGSSGGSDTLTTIVDPSTNGGNWAEIMLFDSITNNTSNANAYRYFSLFRGSSGLYVCQVMWHTAAMPAGGLGIPSLTCKLGSDIFNWLGQDTGRNQLMERVADLNSGLGGINNAPKEVTLLTQGQLAGQFDCKYDFSGDLGSLGFSGWCSTNRASNFGLWMVHPSNEYFADGPMHREILAQMMLINSTFTGVHFGFHPDMSVAAGENWAMVDGPFLLYFNKVASGTANPQTPLYADVMAQTAAERGAWPYSWFSDANYVSGAGRGTVSGRIVISDSGNPNASMSNLWVGLEQQPASTESSPATDFQLWGKCYQFWTHTDGNGNFSIPDVIAGPNYTLFAFGPGAIGQFQSQPLAGASAPVTIYTPASPFSVTVSTGVTNNLGDVVWTPTRVGATVWEIGVPDRDTTEFRHGDDYWHGDMGNATNFAANWAPWQNFTLDFPNDLTYNVGQSHWAKDWDNAQGTVQDPATGNLNANTWTISFNLPNAPGNGAQASIYFGIAASYQGAVIVQVNGNNIAGSTGFFPAYSDSGSANDAMIRMGSHGIFSDSRINFSSTLLHQGQNTITLNMRKGGYFANSTLYDYVRLELAGYVPPAPPNLSASAGNGLVSLFWPAAPGATGYNVSRSTTSGSGYAGIATNVVGPICGSVDDTATFIDTNVVNGTTYYYVVQSANPSGNSSNSVQVSATPSAGTPSAPATPGNVTATGGNNSVSLNWNASVGAARYVIQRTVLTTGAVTTYTPGGINPYGVINSYVTGTNYTDTALANNVTYSYLVSAANANGQSAASSAVNATPSPFIPATPAGLAGSVISNQVAVSWSIVSNASGYVVQRATSVSGPYTTVDYPEPLSFFVDAGLNYNTTYYYRVASASLGGISSNSVSVAVTTTPAPPSPLTAVPGNGQVFVDWGDAAGATNYVLQRSTTSGGPYTTIISTTNSSYLDTTVNNGTTYYYVAYATGPNGQSPLSVQTTATPSSTPQMIKSDTTTMNAAADWSGIAPAIGEVGLFNSVISAANEAALTLGGDVNLGGLIFSNNMNGPVTVGSGNTLTIGSAGIDMGRANQSVTFNNTIALAGLQVWSITNTRTLTVAGTFTSAGNTVIKTGSGTLALGGTSSDAGANIQVNSGVVQANASSGILVSLNGGTFNVNTFDSNPINVMSGGTEQNIGGNRTWAGNLTGSGPLTVIASSTHTWSGDNSAFTGTIALQGGGTLRLSSLSAVSATTAYNFSGGTMSANASGLFSLGSLSGSGTINCGVGQNFSIGALGGSATFSGMIAGGGFIVKAGSGTLILSGANSYTGGTLINSGVLQIGNSGTAGVLGSGNVTNSSILAFNRADAIDDGGFGTIIGTGVLDKLGAGRFALTKPHSYSGSTLIESGTFALANSGAIDSSSGVAVSAGALLDVSGKAGGQLMLASNQTLSGAGSVKGNVVIGAGATLSPGSLQTGSIGTLTFSNVLTLAAGSTNVFGISKSPLTNDLAKIFGALTNGGTLVVTNIGTAGLTNGDSFKLFSAASYSGGFAKVALPSLASGLGWNTNLLNSTGTISVIALSSPTISGIQNGGGNIVLSGSGGTGGWPYVVMGTTNLGGLWGPVATNYFDAGGNFSITLTNEFDPNQPQSFYRLQLQ
jgi:rhamnogalacturonan endolyase